MLRQFIKSKIHRGVITKGDVHYEGSIEIDGELLDKIDLLEGEKVLVASITSGNRLETYVQRGKEGSKEIIINGGAAHLIKKGELVTIMAWGFSEEKFVSKRVVLDSKNEIITSSGL